MSDQTLSPLSQGLQAIREVKNSDIIDATVASRILRFCRAVQKEARSHRYFAEESAILADLDHLHHELKHLMQADAHQDLQHDLDFLNMCNIRIKSLLVSHSR